MNRSRRTTSHEFGSSSRAGSLDDALSSKGPITVRLVAPLFGLSLVASGTSDDDGGASITGREFRSGVMTERISRKKSKTPLARLQ
jgi:hypothetical protein